MNKSKLRYLFFYGFLEEKPAITAFCFHGWCQAKLILSWWPGISSRRPRSVSITSCCHPLNLPWTFDEDKIQETVLHSSICVVTWRGGHVFPGLNSVLHVSRDLFPIPQVAEQAPHSPHSPKITETISLSVVKQQVPVGSALEILFGSLPLATFSQSLNAIFQSEFMRLMVTYKKFHSDTQ